MEAGQDWDQGYFVETRIWESPHKSRRHGSFLAGKSGLGSVHQSWHQTAVTSTASQWRDRPGSREDKTDALFRGFPGNVFTSVGTLDLLQMRTL